MLSEIATLVVIAAAYFYYHRSLFSYAEAVFTPERKKNGFIAASFLLNYIWFTAASLLNLHLIVNWVLFFFLILAEFLIIYRCDKNQGIHLALSGVIMGLAVNILFRCLIALVINKPLSVFDNNISQAENIKKYPIFFGFFLMGVLLTILKRLKFYEKVRIEIESRSILNFHVFVEAILFLYLILNLMGYYVEGNSIALKLWGIKSAAFAILGLNLCNIYMVRMGQLDFYRRRVQEERENMLAQKEEGDKLWTIAFTDPLTGCYNRYYAQEILGEYSGKSLEFCLCFVDNDGLKIVNDRFGHPEGDDYLRTVAGLLKKLMVNDGDYLFRYGGDEFLLILTGTAKEEAMRQIELINDKLKAMKDSKEKPYYMSISCGAVDCCEADSVDRLLQLADNRMYECKRSRSEKAV